MKQEDPCRGVMGEVKKKGNMAVLTLVRQNMDQNQNEGAKKESNVLATREAKESIVQLGWTTHIRDSNMEKCSDAVKARRARGVGKTRKSRMERADGKKSYCYKPNMGVDIKS